MAMMVLLVTAFIYRTMTFDNHDKTHTCTSHEVCVVSLEKTNQEVALSYQADSSTLLVIAPKSLSVTTNSVTTNSEESSITAAEESQSRVINNVRLPITILFHANGELQASITIADQ
ncbi:hypothetical protein VHP8226_01471 [Vibrio hippocampi]|uniref:Uncharacterized protein n=2 Tax=Vibrio hippocampi TaxID=654686 RepID=A0ABN8DG24_9VIBR|nr:hypothetical protein VHP8226_01471 [Vibrio hippocampi]